MAAPTPRRRLPMLSPERFRTVTLVALVVLVMIIVTGTGVRLTGSGLGCEDWPTCNGRSFTPESRSGTAGLIEFGNRLVTGLVSAGVIAAVLGARRRTPRRRDLTILAWSLVGGVAAQAVLGGVTTLTHLNPFIVQAHFLLSMVLLVGATVLHARAARPDSAPPRPRADRTLVTLSWLMVVLLAAAIVAGTVLTGAGPHSGADHEDATRVVRFLVHIPTVARLHGVLVECFTAALLAVLVLAWRRGADRTLVRRGSVAVVVAIAQSIVGYVQYFTGVPAAIVAVHVAGAATLWIVTLRVHLAVLEPVAEDAGAAPSRQAVPA